MSGFTRISNIRHFSYGMGSARQLKPLIASSIFIGLALITAFAYFTRTGASHGRTAITMQAYIWENGDGTSADGNSQLAAQNTALNGIQPGTNLNLRMHLTNGSSATLTSDTDVSLFYDRNDGFWAKVTNSMPAVLPGSGSGCDDSNFNCETLLSSNDDNIYTSMAINGNGQPWVAFYDTNPNDLKVAMYVGRGGTGCASTTAWSCEVVDGSNNVGETPSIAFDATGKAFIAYAKKSSNELRIAEYVGSGGNCDTSGGSDAWQCTVIETVPGGTREIGLAITLSGTKWVSYLTGTSQDLRVARFTGSGTESSCTTGSSNWDCVTVDATNEPGNYTSIAIDGNGDPWVSHYESSSNNLKIAYYVASGGNCDNTGGSDAWECDTIDVTDSVGSHSAIGFAPDGNAWVSYHDSTGSNLRAARFVGSGGNCDTFGSGSDAWECEVVDANGDVGKFTGLAFDPSGAAWIIYADSTNDKLKLARYVGSGGNCDNTGGSDAWQCSVVDSVTPNSTNASTWGLGFDANGTAWISYSDGSTFELKVASFARAGEITTGNSMGVVNGAVLSESHADMTSAADTTNRDDADCISASNWNNGRFFNAENGKGLSLPAGNSTSQCTEVAFAIDTAQAQPGTTYRFVLATDEGYLGQWQGVHQVNIPELTVSPAADYQTRFSKDALYTTGTDCADAEWVCEVVAPFAHTTSNINQVKLTFDREGNPWIAYHIVGAQDLMVANYVGSGGSGCTSSAWNCTLVYSTANSGRSPGIVFDHNNTAHVLFQRNTGNTLRHATYVGSGGSGCDSSAWTGCNTILTGLYRLNLAVSPAGQVAAVGYDNSTNIIQYVEYVGSGGSGCTSSAWNCTSIDDISIGATTRFNLALKFDSKNQPWIAYTAGDDDTSTHLRVATYSGGSTGTGCAYTLEWTCNLIDGSGDSSGSGRWADMAIGADDSIHIAYHLSGATSRLRYATYVGSGGTGCDTSAWTCSTIDNSPSYDMRSIAVDTGGNPWITYTTSTQETLRYARYVGSGGSGCAVSSAWTCASIDTSSGDKTHLSLAFDQSGAAWVAYGNAPNNTLLIAKQKLPSTPLGAGIVSYGGAGSSSGGDLRYSLSLGKTPYTSANGDCGAASANQTGYCGLYSPDGYLDSMTAGAYQRPVYGFAQKFSGNTDLPNAQVHFGTSAAPSSQSVVLQVYRFGTGSNNGWVTIGTNDSTSCPTTSGCVVEGVPGSGSTASEYYEQIGSDYWAYFRVYQMESTSTTTTLNIDSFKVVPQSSWMRHGRIFQNELNTPYLW